MASRMISERAVDRSIVFGIFLYASVVAAALCLSGADLSPADPASPSAAEGAAFSRIVRDGAATLTYDDGFYYLKIAQEIARGAGSTFDGVHPTNGYHPLWLICLVPFFWLKTSTDAALVLVVILQGLLFAISAGLAYRIARLDLSPIGAALGALLWIHAQLPYRTVMSGLECGAQTVAVLAAMYAYGRWFARDSPGVRAHLALGIGLAAAFLFRLENALLVGCVAGVLATRELRRGWGSAGWRRLGALLLPAGAAFAIYAAINARLFGHAFPVSGVIKRDWSAQLLASDPAYRRHGWLFAKAVNLTWPFGHMKHAYVFFLAAGTAGVVAASLGSCFGARSFHWLRRWRPFVFFSLLQLSTFLVVYHQGYSFQRWYYVVQPLLGALLLACAGEQGLRWLGALSPAASGMRALPAGLSVAALGVVALASARAIEQWHEEAHLGTAREPLYAAAAWVQANVPEDDAIGAWNAGTIGYLSGRRVVNLDGLVNSWQFYQVKSRDLCAYFREAGIAYLVDTYELDHELAFIGRYYAPGVDLSPCAARFDRVWIGPPYLHTSQYAIAFRLR